MDEMLHKKIDSGLSAALGAMRSQVKAGVIDPEHFKRIASEIFTDPMTGMGNKKAYADFLSRPRNGVHVRIDGNDFGDINKTHGFEAGDGAIRAMGTAIREALHQSVDKSRAKSFRLGGDEFHLHVPDERTAARFSRAVREKLEAIAPIGGTHGLSLSVGFGQTPEHAEQALMHAKTAKKTAGYKLGQARTHVHSLLPATSGAVPVENTVKPALAPPPMTPAPEEPVAKAQRAAPKAPKAPAATPPQGDAASFVGNSVVVDKKKKPLLVFRGEHGPGHEPGKFQSRLPSLSFGSSKETAQAYAHDPNDRTLDRTAHDPRVIPAYLRMEKPWLNSPDDPFVDLSHVEQTLGHDRAMWVAREFGDHIANTNAWHEATEERPDDKYDEPHEFIAKHPEAMNSLCVQAYPLLDHPEFVEHLKQLGYDGAIHAGSGENFDEPEYRVFDHAQALPQQVIKVEPEIVTHPVPVEKTEPPPPTPDRITLEGTARVILGPLMKFEDLDDTAIRKAVIQKVHPNVALDGQSADYVRARFDIAVEAAVARFSAPEPLAPVLKAEDIAATVTQALEKMGKTRPANEDAEVEFVRDDEGRVTGARLVRKK